MKKVLGTTLLSASLLLSSTQLVSAEEIVGAEETIQNEETAVEETVETVSTENNETVEPPTEETSVMPTAEYEQQAYNAVKSGKTFTHHGITITDKNMLSRYIKYHLLDGYYEINVSHYRTLANRSVTNSKVYITASAVKKDILFQKYGYFDRFTRDKDYLLSFTIYEPQAAIKTYYATLAERMQVYIDSINERTTTLSQMRFLYDLARTDDQIDFHTLELAIAASNFKGKKVAENAYAITLNGHQYVTVLGNFDDPNMYYLLPKRDFDMSRKYRPLVNVKRDLLKSDPFYQENRIVKVSKFTKTLKSFGKDVSDQKTVYFLLEEDIRLGSGRINKAQETLKTQLNLQDVKIKNLGIYLKVTYTK